ncbi:MAG: hypothetical protein ACUVQR_13475 [Thermogutta sp.]
MNSTTIGRSIIKSLCEEPKQHWSYACKTRMFNLLEGRCAVSYVVAMLGSKAFDDPEMFSQRGSVSLLVTV